MTLLEALIHIRDNGPREKSAGICFNLDVILIDANSYDYLVEFRRIYQEWDGYSGDSSHPVSGEKLYRSHKLDGTLWTGEQLALRIDLINFVIKELQNQISESASSN